MPKLTRELMPAIAGGRYGNQAENLLACGVYGFGRLPAFRSLSRGAARACRPRRVRGVCSHRREVLSTTDLAGGDGRRSPGAGYRA